MTVQFPTMVPDPDPDLDPGADEHVEWILAWYLAEDRALRQFETGEVEDDDPDEHGCLSEQRIDEEDNSDLLPDDDSDHDRDNSDDDGIA